MSDDAGPGGNSRHQLPILLGVLGAVLGFIGAVFLAPFNRMDPMTSGWTAMLFFGPLGAVSGLLLGVKIGRSLRGEEGAGSFGGSSLKALAIVIGAVVVIGGGYALYAVTTATPWLRPGGVALQFEVRLPAGAPMPPANGVKAELQTSINTMPAEMKPAAFRLDGDRPVLVGEVDLAYRTNSRQVEVKIPGRMDRTYQIKLTDTAPHSSALGAWQSHPDGSEIRYRAKWPGQD